MYYCGNTLKRCYENNQKYLYKKIEQNITYHVNNKSILVCDLYTRLKEHATYTEEKLKLTTTNILMQNNHNVRAYYDIVLPSSFPKIIKIIIFQNKFFALK